MSTPKLSWFQYFAVGSFIAGWIAKALVPDPDGRIVITRAEMQELLDGVLSMLGMSEVVIED